MDSMGKAAFNRALLVVSIAVSGLIFQGCGKSGSSAEATKPQAEATTPQAEQTRPDLSQREALIAVESAVANIDAMQNGGGYQSWTADQVVEKVVPLMNSAQTPAPGDPVGAAPRFTYVAGRASGPWQVVLRAEGNTVHVEAYGSSTSAPLEKRSVPVQ